MPRNVCLLAALSFAVMCAPITAAEPAKPTPLQIEFFEKHIRPVLVERCYECHNSATAQEGSLALDWRDALLAGGDSGPAIVPGKPNDSLLIRAIRHSDKGLKMPQGGPKMPEPVVAAFVKWVEMGAPDPRNSKPSAEDVKKVASWEAIRERRKEWWSFQPVASPAVPPTSAWSSHEVDRFLEARLATGGLRPAADTDRGTWLRRITFALAGLPPTPEELAEFLADKTPDAHERTIDRLLASPRYGERWARHWLDWFRYAETHGSEGDPQIPHAWRYRDYVIRAINADIPYDQMLREALAGDLLDKPRANAELGLNESALGIGHLRMVQHGYAPTDALDEQVNFTDNQVDVLSKAVLGLTVSCARCHNHKFDPISQTDFYALYGILASCRPAVITVDTRERQQMHRARLMELKGEIKSALADAWLASTDGLAARMLSPSGEEAARWKGATDEAAAAGSKHPLNAWTALEKRDAEGIKKGWKGIVEEQKTAAGKSQEFASASYPNRWRLTESDYPRWFGLGTGLPEKPSPAGEFSILPAGEQLVLNIYPAGVYTHLLSNKHNGILTSPRFKIETDELHFRVAGGGDARVRFVVANYPRAAGPIYHSLVPNREQVGWSSLNTKYWKGEWAYLEIATGQDVPVEVKGDGRSWFGITEMLGRDGSLPPPFEASASLAAVTANDAQPANRAELTEVYARSLRSCIEAWQRGTMTDAQATFLAAFVRPGLLPNTLAALPKAAPLAAEYRKLEGEIPIPTRAPGVLEGTPLDQPLYVRGNHRQPDQPVARRFLEALDARPYHARQSGRRELAESLLAPSNPLVARVIVNRLWNHLYGEGIVPTVDNFGHLGEQPTHPELLDYLAARFVREGWSLKRMVRYLATARAMRMSSDPSERALATDPANKLLSHFRLRRLEAEAIRDSILATSGRLDGTMFGKSVYGGTPRRSIYVAVNRNSLDAFLDAFDGPETLTTQGRRDATNVPAQSLMLLNDPFVLVGAQKLAESVLRDETLAEPTTRLKRMFLRTMGREPGAEELSDLDAYLGELAVQHNVAMKDIAHSQPVWQSVAHALFNVKEFIYVR